MRAVLVLAAVAVLSPGVAVGTVASGVRADAASAVSSTSAARVASQAAPVASGGTDAAGVDDFSFSSYEADFYLDRDGNGRSTLETVETFVAEFPAEDQNRGMRRVIPLDYDGHPTEVHVESVVDRNGEPRQFEAEKNDDGDFLVVTVRADDYVHGSQSYTFLYTQKNVTKYFADSDDDEFYWDTIGFDSAQEFGRATARVHVPQDLAGSLNGSASCYAGAYGSDASCPISKQEADGDTVFTAGEVALGAHENVSVAIGFELHTFVPRDDSFFATWTGWAQLAAIVVAVAGVGLAIIRRITRLRDAPGRRTIVAEYTPPKGVSVFTSSVILKRTARAAASGFLSLAVRGNIQIIERPPASARSRKPEYWLRAVHTDGLEADEREFYRLIFRHRANGEGELSAKDTELSTGVQSFMKMARVRAADCYSPTDAGTAVLLTGVVWAAAFATIIFGGIVAGQDRGGGWPILLLVLGILCAMVVPALVFRRPLSAAGSELRDYLRGIRLYLTVAEEERFRMLQSPEGALTADVSAADPGQVVKLYEKLLPFAVLWGVEKQWANVLGSYYERAGDQPQWYGGPDGFSGGFNPVLFAASVGSFSSTAASSYSGSAASDSSSSSGGAGGGGSSGGGGGGGGAGGV